jgi:hypothetical protein
MNICRQRSISQDSYWIADELLSTELTPDRMLRASLRCLQVLIANSDGGGMVYNSILLGPFSGLTPSTVADTVLQYRCRDSIGVFPMLQGDGNDRLRRAFSIAWKRGLYMAAYSLPPATVRGQLKLKVVK